MDNNNEQILPLIKISRTAVIVQLMIIPTMIVIVASLGEPFKTAQEAFAVLEESQVLGLIRDDLYNVVMISLYFLSFPGLYFLLRRNNFTLAFLATLFTFSAVIFALTAHSGFSLLHLSNLYWEASDEAIKAGLIMAGDTVIAQNMWNSSAGYFAGILLQGGGVLISIAMIRSKDFTLLTIISGIAANGLDLLQHLIHPFFPSISQIFIYLMGPFYIIWFVMLAVNLHKYIKKEKRGILLGN